MIKSSPHHSQPGTGGTWCSRNKIYRFVASSLARISLDALGDEITDEMLDQYGLIANWDDMADRLIDRYKGTASRVVMYLGQEQIRHDDEHLGKWAEVARAVRNG